MESRITTLQAGPVYMMTLFLSQAVPTYTSTVHSKGIVVTLYKMDENQTGHV